MKKFERDYIAMVTVYGAGKMMNREKTRLVDWLRRTALDIDQNFKEMSEGRYTARLMKPKELFKKPKK